jgi:hypothetical protein
MPEPIFTSRCLRPEVEFVLCCARSQLGSPQVERVAALLEGPLDWSVVTGYACRQRVVPLLYRHLPHVAPGAVPATVVRSLREPAGLMARRNLMLAGALVEIVGELDRSGITAAPFKGPVLSLMAYGDLALREFEDLDLLVHPRDLHKARKVLLELGFEPDVHLNQRQEAAHLRSEYHYTFLRKADELCVELHWRITSRHFWFPLDLDALWTRLHSTTFFGKTVSQLPPEETLLVLCAHGMKHFWGMLSFVCDVAEQVRSYPAIDWDGVQQHARKLGSERMLLLGLVLAAELLDAPVPPKLLKRAERDGALRPLVDRVQSRLLDVSAEPPGIFERNLLRIQARERLRDKLRFCLDLIATPRVADWETVTLPPWLAPLYYLVRPFRLVLKYSRPPDRFPK